MKTLTLQELEQLEKELERADYLRSSLCDPKGYYPKGQYKFWVKPLVMDRTHSGKAYYPCAAYVETRTSGTTASVNFCCRINDGVKITDYEMEFDKLPDFEKKCVQLYYEKKD